MATTTSNSPSERAAESRARILDAALKEFSANGLAGARTDRIAASAGVNKALLYYYFDSKENLYLAALEMISAKIRDRTMAVFLLECSAGERVVRSALEHFDRILTQHEFQGLMQQEMIRMHKGESGALEVVVKRVFAPVLTMYQSMVREGIASGELIEADWLQVHLATLGANVFYFLSAPIMEMLLEFKPFELEALRKRRIALAEFLGQAIFRDRVHGADVAARVLADSPMPVVEFKRFVWGKNNDERTQ